MPPRHHYWTIIFGNQPTSFRAATREELLPTFRQIQARHPDAVMMWFASGRLWRSEEEFRDARFKRREDEAPPKRREGGDWKARGPKPAWKDRPRGPRPPAFARKPFTPGSGEAPLKRREGGDWNDRPRDQPGPPPAKPPVSPKPRSGEGGKPRSGEGWKPHTGEGGRPNDRGPKPPAFARKPSKPGYGEAPPKRHEGGDWKARGPKPAWKDRPRGPRPPAFARKPFTPGSGEAPLKRREGGEWKDRPRDQPVSPPAKPPVSPKPRSGEGGKPRSGEGWKPHTGEGGRPNDRGPKPPAFARKPFKPGYGAPPKRREGGDWKNPSPKPREGGDWKDRPRDHRGQPVSPPVSPKPRSGEGGKPPSGEGWKDKPRDGDRPHEPRQKDRWRDRPAPPPGSEAKRGRDWRPGGQHKDPRERFKVPRDVRRARFKQKAWRDRTNPKPPGPKKKDEE